jgi:hypothetical protein
VNLSQAWIISLRAIAWYPHAFKLIFIHEALLLKLLFYHISYSLTGETASRKQFLSEGSCDRPFRHRVSWLFPFLQINAEIVYKFQVTSTNRLYSSLELNPSKLSIIYGDQPPHDLSKSPGII